MGLGQLFRGRALHGGRRRAQYQFRRRRRLLQRGRGASHPPVRQVRLELQAAARAPRPAHRPMRREARSLLPVGVQRDRRAQSQALRSDAAVHLSVLVPVVRSDNEAVRAVRLRLEERVRRRGRGVRQRRRRRRVVGMRPLRGIFCGDLGGFDRVVHVVLGMYAVGPGVCDQEGHGQGGEAEDEATAAAAEGEGQKGAKRKEGQQGRRTGIVDHWEVNHFGHWRCRCTGKGQRSGQRCRRRSGWC
mmetsp:Transcript_43063/g.79903  ORF Transcript_43063/g.79903 Transcript_43063/m.79903 type:complete len:245 (-) Transcript_43063:130-864(-)